MSEFQTGQYVLKNASGYVLAGFNRRIFGWTYLEAFKHEAERANGDLHLGWNAAEKLISEGKLFYVHNFHRSHECPDGSAFQYGGVWVCNACNKSRLDKDWWTIKVYQDGNAWCCVGLGFEDLQASDNYALGDTRDESIKTYGDIMAGLKIVEKVES